MFAYMKLCTPKREVENHKNVSNKSVEKQDCRMMKQNTRKKNQLFKDFSEILKINKNQHDPEPTYIPQRLINIIEKKVYHLATKKNLEIQKNGNLNCFGLNQRILTGVGLKQDASYQFKPLPPRSSPRISEQYKKSLSAQLFDKMVIKEKKARVFAQKCNIIKKKIEDINITKEELSQKEKWSGLVYKGLQFRKRLRRQTSREMSEQRSDLSSRFQQKQDLSPWDTSKDSQNADLQWRSLVLTKQKYKKPRSKIFKNNKKNAF